MSSLGTYLQRHRAVRWLAPVGVLGAVAVAAGGMITARANPEPLPPATPVELVAGLQSTEVPGFSGTIVAQMSLGLPSLPALAGSSGEASMTSLLAGSHTLRFWYGGPDKQRVALLGETSEVDVFHSGSDVWQWDSDSRTATHVTLSAHDDTRPVAPTTVATLSPDELARRAIAAMDSSTKVTVDGTRVVAHRTAYVLVFTPRDAATRIGSVRIAVDGATKVPLAVQIFARGSTAAAVDVAFSDVSFRVPSNGNFSFTPPPGAIVRNGVAPVTASAPHKAEPSVIGKGWSSVLEYHASASQLNQVGKGTLNALQRVSGAWGSGRLLESPLGSALVTDDGRVFAGAVDPGTLYSAAATHK